MNSMAIIRGLARSPHFTGIPTEVLHGISMHASLQKMSPGELLGTRLQPSDAVWVIADGRVEVRRLQGYEGRRLEVALSILKPGMIFGHVSLLSEQPRTATFVAASPGALLRFDRKSFSSLLADHQQAGAAFRRAVILALGNQLHAVNQRLDLFIQDSGDQVESRRELLRAALDGAVQT